MLFKKWSQQLKGMRFSLNLSFLKREVGNRITLLLIAVTVLPLLLLNLLTGALNSLAVILYSVLMIVLSIVVSLLLRKSLQERIRQISEVMERAEQGDLTVRIEVTSDDEIGQLGQRINATLEAISSLIRQVGEMTEQVAASSEELTASSMATSEAAQEIKNTMREVAMGAEEQLEKVENITAILEELNSSFNQVAENSEIVANTANSVMHSSEMGQELVKSVVSQMESIHNAVNHSAAAVKSLGQQSASIQGFVSTITEIAAQTNLLALNAAIEAARAGEAGRGFSVVADEVRKLAEQSAKAAGEVSQIVERILKETDNSAEAMNEGIRSVEQGLEVVAKAGEVFHNIHASITEVARQIQEVNTSVREMTEGNEASVHSIMMISSAAAETVNQTFNVFNMTDEQTSTSSEISASAEALARLAEELNVVVNQFRV
jgi:methyl-accepting chemotaxis protein